MILSIVHLEISAPSAILDGMIGATIGSEAMSSSPSKSKSLDEFYAQPKMKAMPCPNMFSTRRVTSFLDERFVASLNLKCTANPKESVVNQLL